MSEFSRLTEIQGSCLEACAELAVKPKPIAEGVFIRTPTQEDRHGKKSGSIYAFKDGKGGIVFNYQTHLSCMWLNDRDKFQKLSKKEKKTYLAEAYKAQEEQRKIEAIELAARNKNAANAAADLIELSQSSRPDWIHEYWKKKGLAAYCELFGVLDISTTQAALQSYGIQQGFYGCEGPLLVIPLYQDRWQVASVQFIPSAGHKTFLLGGRIAGSFWFSRALMPPVTGESEVLGVAEGVATALSVMALYGVPCIAGMNAGNLGAAALTALRNLPQRKIRFYADSDQNHAGQEGAEKGWNLLPSWARSWKTTPNGMTRSDIVYPQFSADQLRQWDLMHGGPGGKPPTDFNDLWVLRQETPF